MLSRPSLIGKLFLMRCLCFSERNEHAFSVLERSALIRRSGNVVSIHRLLQESVFLNLDIGEQREVFQAALLLMSRAWPRKGLDDDGDNTDYDGPRTDLWDRQVICVEHVLALLDRFVSRLGDESTRLQGSKDFLVVLEQTGYYLYESSQYQACFNLVDKAVKMCKLPKDHYAYAWLLNMASNCHFTIGDLKQAERGYNRMLLGLESSAKAWLELRDFSSDTLEAVVNHSCGFDPAKRSNKAQLDRMSRSEKELEDLHWAAYKIRYRVLDLDMQTAGTGQSNLSQVYAARGDPGKLIETIGRTMKKW